MIKYEVIDNFLSDSDFTELKNIILPTSIPGDWGNLPWIYQGSNVVRGDDNYDEPSHLKKVTDIEPLNLMHDWYFAHLLSFSSTYIPHPPFLNVFLNKISPLAVYRIQANFTVQQEKRMRSLFHIDRSLAPSMVTSIFYMNTTNGPTILEDGTEIDCRANRLATFPYDTYHSGVMCTDQPYRIVINLNYFIDRNI